jgi:NADH dehydrogenase
MEIHRVCVLGGTGFIGRSVVEQLAEQGMWVRVLTRNREKARGLFVLPTGEVVNADVNDDATLARQFEGMDAVVNLIGILHQSRRQPFEKVHVELPARVGRACRAAGVARLLQMSALGASSGGPSEYLKSRGRGEAAVKDAAGSIPITIFQPSIVIGACDDFLNMFAKLVQLFPVIPLAGAKTRFQPIWVEDVARAMVASLADPRTFGKTYQLGGPKIYTLEQLVTLVIALKGRSRMILPLPHWAATLQAAAFEYLPGPIMTRDNLKSMSVDNVCSEPWPAEFAFKPSSIEGIVAEYLTDATQRGRYKYYRNRAGR